MRVLAAELLARFDPKRAAKLADKMLSDRPSFNRLVAAHAVHATDVAAAAAQVHYQPVALPVIVAEKDVPTLAAVAKDRKAPKPCALGAIEGLGRDGRGAGREGARRDRHARRTTTRRSARPRGGRCGASKRARKKAAAKT